MKRSRAINLGSNFSWESLGVSEDYGRRMMEQIEQYDGPGNIFLCHGCVGLMPLGYEKRISTIIVQDGGRCQAMLKKKSRNPAKILGEDFTCRASTFPPVFWAIGEMETWQGKAKEGAASISIAYTALLGPKKFSPPTEGSPIMLIDTSANDDGYVVDKKVPKIRVWPIIVVDSEKKNDESRTVRMSVKGTELTFQQFQVKQYDEAVLENAAKYALLNPRITEKGICTGHLSHFVPFALFCRYMGKSQEEMAPIWESKEGMEIIVKHLDSVSQDM